MSELVEKDYEVKLEKRQNEINYYKDKSVELDLKPTARFTEYHPDPSKSMLSGVTFAHRDLESVVKSMANKQPWAVVSGLNPSGPLHFGHKQVFEEVLWMQKQGAEVFIPITNDESYLVGKVKSLAESRKIAYEKVIPSIIALGFDSEKTHIFVDSDYPELYNLAIDISKHLSLNKVFKVFGFGQNKEDENPGTIFFRGGVQLAQILMPQYEEFGGKKPSVIPVGIDQYPYILLARDAALKKGFIPPAATFTKFEEGLDGKGKMSASRPNSAIFLTEDQDTIKRKIKSSYTGGSPSGAFQKEHGGVPEICPIFQLRSYHFAKNNELKNDCSNGVILCGECKKQATEETLKYVSDHQSKFPQAKSQINDFLLDKKIKSILIK
ncbi:MAG: tryptophan--tRNA ligase [Candidatus Woesebacteria bacterium]|nr:tryptophan--tRNA ligase [Candidatus Woesebacteria bacterium]